MNGLQNMKSCAECGKPSHGQVCRMCFSRVGAKYRRSYVVTCAVCGAPTSEHLRCAGCSILVGPAHVTKAVGADGLCDGCRKARQMRVRLGLPAVVVDDDVTEDV
jgi:hypothetical protein